MSCNTQEFPGFTWTPEDPRGPGHAALDRWLATHGAKRFLEL